MSDEINIQQVAELDDVGLAAKYLEVVKTPDHLHTNNGGGDPVSAMWIAAALGARNVVRLFVQQGADVNFEANSVSVRQLGLLNTETLLGMIEGGLRPNGTELARIFLTGYSSEIPVEQRVKQAGLLIDLDPDLAPDRNEKAIRSLMGTPEFLAIIADLAGIDHSNCTQMMSNKDARRQINSIGVNTYRTIASIAHEAVACVATHSDEIDQIIVRRFIGYRKNRTWLAKSAADACDEMCAQLSPKYDLYEDDEDLRFRCNLIISRYPVKERLKGLGNETQPSRLSGLFFETEVAEQLQAAGFNAQRIGQSGDQGADVIATKDGLRFVIQCKDYTTPVGNAAVQQVLAAKAHYGTDYAVVCASTGFTKSAKSLGATAGVLLIPPTLLPQLMTLRQIVE